MARRIETEADYPRAKVYFELGMPVDLICQQVDSEIKNPNRLKTTAKKFGWEKAKLMDVMNEEIRLQKKITEVAELKKELTPLERDIIASVAFEKYKAQQYIEQIALENARQSMNAECDNQLDYKNRAATISMTKDVVMGKQPETAVQVNNNQPSKIIFEIIDSKEQIDKK